MSHFNSRTALSGALFFSLLLVCPHVGFAQDIPGAADAGRVRGNLETGLPQAGEADALKIDRSAMFAAPEGAENIRFVLKEVVVEGASVYTQNQLGKLYAARINKSVSLADIYALAATLTAKYRNDGYILTQVVVPPQTIDNGVVHLRVVEGSIDQIRIEGTEILGSGGDVIRGYADRLKEGGILNNSNLERALLLINDLPGVTARSVLSPSATKTGMSDLTIIVERDPFEGVAGLNNYGSRFLGMWQATTSLYANSLLGYNEQFSVDLAYSPSNQGLDPELTYGQMKGEVPVNSLGTTFAVHYGVTNTVPGHTLDVLDVKGFSRFGGLELKHPFVRTRDVNLSATAGLDVRSTKTKSNIPTETTDDLTMLRMAGHLSFVDTLFSAAVTNVDLGLHKGVGWFGASDKGDPDLSRPDADPEAVKVTLDANRLERLYGAFSLQMGVSGQLSSAPLLSSEEFGVGGANSIGRGYDPSELVGDDGLSGSLELQWTNVAPAPYIDSYTVYGFYDIGKVWNDDATSPSLREQSLASAGVGVRTTIATNAKADLMVAVPLTRDVAAENDDDPRLYANFSYRF